jgi:arsenate reductase (glutaredoxin)
MNTLYGIKNCDAVKKARAWLDAHQVQYCFHDFRADGLTEAQVNLWINEMGVDALDNKRSTTWKELSDALKANFTPALALKTIVAQPTLIKRPLLDTGSSKHIGFKESDYSALFT